MTEQEIQVLIRNSDTNTGMPWNALLNAYVTQLAAISAQLPPEALDAMIHLGAACHKKAFAELTASEQTEIALHNMKAHGVRLNRRVDSANPYFD